MLYINIHLCLITDKYLVKTVCPEPKLRVLSIVGQLQK